MMQRSISAAQYLRMSTEKQEYSLDNQAAAIADFARSQGYTLVETYSDAARSGVTLRQRHGLMRLLSDVASGQNRYAAVLVYDVSRWGRFQDVDESAHYEFLCRSAGVSVQYCAESFSNDGSLGSALMKALKRSMAAEFSRELGLLELAAKKTIVAAGFHVGGRTPYGLRRKIVSDNPDRARTLEIGEWKYVRCERLTLVPGPLAEVSCIRTIFKSVLKDGLNPREISRKLNAEGTTLRGRRWTQESVYNVLTNARYAGFSIWGCSSQRLGTPTVKVSPDQWAVKPDSFAPIISKSDFEKAKKLVTLERGRVFWTHDRALRIAKELLTKYGKLSLKLFDQTPAAPHSAALRKLGFAELCQRAGYTLPPRYTSASIGLKLARRWRNEVLTELMHQFPNELSIVAGQWPPLLLDGQTIISLLVCRTLKNETVQRWRIHPRLRDINHITIVCLLDASNTAPERVYVFPKLDFQGTRQIGPDDPWLRTGCLLQNVSQLCSALRTAAHNLEP